VKSVVSLHSPVVWWMWTFDDSLFFEFTPEVYYASLSRVKFGFDWHQDGGYGSLLPNVKIWSKSQYLGSSLPCMGNSVYRFL